MKIKLYKDIVYITETGYLTPMKTDFASSFFAAFIQQLHISNIYRYHDVRL